MNLQITFVCVLKDETWGFSDLVNGRDIEDCREEIIELLNEDIGAVLENYKISIKEIQ